ncbi:MAG: CidA/LrgA family protein [Oscillospiraceae bacterium]
MKYINQFIIIIFISFIGEILHTLIPLPVPASIYGLVIMLVLLIFRMLPLSAVKEAGKFLLDIMPMMFIPAAVGLMVSWDALKPICIPVIIMTVVSTVAVMAVSGRVTQFVIRTGEKRKKGSGTAK